MKAQVIPMPSRGRKHLRFPLSLPLTYKAKSHRGAGQTLNISSHGMLAALDKPLPIGMVVEVSLQWPAELEGTPLQLVCEGKVVRQDAQGTAISAERHEFRTRSRAAVRMQVNWPLRKAA